MKRNVVVVSHADADGHVIAEQVRRNLGTVESFKVSTVIDPVRTKDHKAWLHLDSFPEIEKADLVLFVDLMFAPSTYAAEAAALVRFVKDRPNKHFFLFDHHPLPLRLLSSASNLRAVYREDVLDCTVGTSSPMMIIAALCEKQFSRARAIRKPIDDVIAKGLKRAAAPGGTLPGEKLSALLRHGCWKDFERLGREPLEKHRLPRGRRPRGQRPSKVLAQLEKTANELLTSASGRPRKVGDVMSFDFEAVTDRTPPVVTTHVPQAKDLEAIVTLMQLAAIELSPTPGTEFTKQQLFDQMRELAGDDLPIQLSDVVIVFDKSSFLKKATGGKLTLR